MLLLDIRDLHFSYPDGRQALRGVHLQVRQGEKIALVGPNGAGKSTLMLHCNGILRGRGTICVAGEELSDATVGRIRAMVGLVFQDPDDQLFSPTVFEDVAFGPLHIGLPEDEVRRRVDTALDAVGMLAYRERISHHLSTGEKKRIAIATVLSMQPQLLVLDEPTAGLDPRARRSLIELLRSLDMTMIVSTHDMPMIPELFPRMVVMDDGCVVADGSSAALLDDQALLARHGLEYP
jgi:cobalt/nickel transport system ATP-binding protein